jgi:hypothetical protein
VFVCVFVYMCVRALISGRRGLCQSIEQQHTLSTFVVSGMIEQKSLQWEHSEY